jgi:hypothetical protein
MMVRTELHAVNRMKNRILSLRVSIFGLIGTFILLINRIKSGMTTFILKSIKEPYRAVVEGK